MADPGRPVTGYPAPNQPPPGVSYPYAAPPPSGAYFNYHNNPQSNQYYPDNPQRLVFLRRIFALAIGALLIFGTVSFVMWLIFRPQLPQFQVDSLAVSNFTLGNSSLVSFTSAIRLTAVNPNRKLRLDYDHIQAALSYRSATLSETSVPPFSQETRSVTSLTANFAAAGSFLDGSEVSRINGERLSNGNVNFNLRMLSEVFVSCNGMENEDEACQGDMLRFGCWVAE